MDLVEQARSLGITGFLHPAELAKLQELATGRDVLELGSYRGLSAWGMAQTANSVTCCDTFKAADNGQRQTTDEDRGGKPYTTFDAFCKAVERFNNVTIYPVSSEEAAKLIHGRFDMVFIDADHTYESVRADIKRWWPRLRKGGILALHDYGHDAFEGVKQAVDEIFGPAPEGTTVITLRWIEK